MPSSQLILARVDEIALNDQSITMGNLAAGLKETSMLEDDVSSTDKTLPPTKPSSGTLGNTKSQD